jgi:hypothetical protein
MTGLLIEIPFKWIESWILRRLQAARKEFADLQDSRFGFRPQQQRITHPDRLTG